MISMGRTPFKSTKIIDEWWDMEEIPEEELIVRIAIIKKKEILMISPTTDQLLC